MSDETSMVMYRGRMVTRAECQRLAKEDDELATQYGDLVRKLADVEKKHNTIRVAEQLAMPRGPWPLTDTLADWQIITLLKDWQEMHAALSNIARNGDTAAQYVIDKLECKP
jgi:hypothetical protein